MINKLLTSVFGSRNQRLVTSFRKGVVESVNALEARYAALSDAA